LPYPVRRRTLALSPSHTDSRAANRWRYQPCATVHLPGGPFGASRVAGLICDRSMDLSAP